MFRTTSIFLILLITAAAPVFAQFKEGDASGAKTGPSQTHKWQAGVVIQASAGPCRSVVGYVPVPMEWPEQTVKIVQQDFSPGVKVSYQTLEESAKLMVVRIPWIANGEQAKAVVTFECNRSMQMPPEDKSTFVLPAAKDLTPALRHYLGSSPMIEVQDVTIRKSAKENGSGAKTAWERVEALYDFMRTKVQYENGIESKGAAAALRNGKANHDDMAALFVALCRDAEVPAHGLVAGVLLRRVLSGGQKRRRALASLRPAGAKAFGEMPDTKLILAKGDNFRPPEVRKPQRYIRTYLNAAPGTQNAGRPSVQWIGQQVN